MPLTLQTPPNAAANSYVSLAAAVAYFEGRLSTTLWDSTSDAVRSRALVAATARLEQSRWIGKRSADGQPLAWPRDGVVNDDQTNYYAADVIPGRIVAATCELALHLLTGAQSGDALAETGLEGFKRVKLGPLEVEPNTSKYTAGELPPQVRRIIAPLVQGGGSGGFAVVRG